MTRQVPSDTGTGRTGGRPPTAPGGAPTHPSSLRRVPHAPRPAPRTRADVLAARRASGTTVAAVVPARDEATTVATVVGGLRELVGDGLLEEVVVVVAGSDGTAEAAAAAGARVIAQEARPRGLPAGGGKGDALWQGVVATTADVVVFVDADIRGFEPDFVVPLLGPLLTDGAVHLTKAAYDRPLGTSGAAHGGGRVTELLARPLLASLWPELSFLAQPLSGEYAGRRSLLESVPFVQGYGVELALLVDTVARLGPEAIRQVDLGVRHHAHQPLDALGRMAAEILAVGLDRAAEQGRTPADEPLLRQPRRDELGVLHLVDHAVRVRQRPPSAG